ncbi:hypothetical protein N7447_010166 [Penicillium robsamsonii]|uniref:uncharacterized protein n=1 Tax=Penicillium robsamsonii TaxID=1792511 RepID=UPI002547B0A5|nr:uncharacterized protein N7447_010166 [Penicillium robsamsonii]KAJ5813143.1 hypothetical protein N7447_010166 [Penicillium robsamsonii]
MVATNETALPPGTIRLIEMENDEVILVPTPSTHPDDPLNWSKGRKLLSLSLILLYTFTTGVGGTSVYSVLTPISKETRITIGQLNTGTGFLFLMAGWSNLIWQPLAETYGRRPVLLLSLIGCVAITEWTAWIPSYSSWAAARCLYGILCGPAEVLPEVCMSDIFFAHERGTYIAMYMFVLCGSNFIAPLIAGFVNDGAGWHWVQHWSAILLGVNLVLTFFFYEETIYTRSAVEATEADLCLPDHNLNSSDCKRSLSPPPVALEEGLIYELKSYKDKLKLWSYQCLSLSQFFRMMYRPVFIFFLFPNIMWAGFMYGSALAWFNVYNATASSILTAVPYKFSATSVGVTYVAPLIGTIFAGAINGPLSDWYTIRLARRSNGLREPEQRLWGLTAYCIAMPAGLLLWGLGAAHHLHWVVLLLGALLIGFCNVAGGSYALAYCVDSFRDIASESLVSVILCRNTMSFAINYGITPWLEANGMQNTFIATAVLALVVGCSFWLMIFKGKHFRTVCADRYRHYVATQVASRH